MQAIEAVPGFVGFRFYHVPNTSGTGLALQQAAQKLGLVCYDEGNMPAPVIDLTMTGTGIAHKKSLVRHQRFFERECVLSIRHFSTASDILPRLECFFEQHIARWAVTPYPSLFLDPAQCQFYEALAGSAGPNSWLRFTEVDWNDSPVAFHFGFRYGSTYMWYKPSFTIELAKHSPGEVLMRNLLLKALDEGAGIFDLGPGAEHFKQRFATRTQLVRTWGLYPSIHERDNNEQGRNKVMKVLVVSPHPDDEAIGCGGTLRKHILEGDEVRVVFLTSGAQGSHGLPHDETIRLREHEAMEAARTLGVDRYEFWRKLDGGLEVTAELVDRMIVLLRDYRPDTSYVTNDNENHEDHRAAAHLLQAAKNKEPRVSHQILMYEVWTPLTDMDEVVDITPFLDNKIAAIRSYKSQCGVLRFDDAA